MSGLRIVKVSHDLLSEFVRGNTRGPVKSNAPRDLRVICVVPQEQDADTSTARLLCTSREWRGPKEGDEIPEYEVVFGIGADSRVWGNA